MSLSQLSTPLSKDQAFALVDAVMEHEDLALTAAAHEGENDEWIFEATCDQEPDIEAFNALALEVLGGAVGFSIEKLDTDTDWVSNSLKDLKPVVAGGYYLFGSHHTDTPPAGLIPLHIEAAQAFGTGHHETTTGCLQAIQDVLKRKKPRVAIDIGTGTGVLAIALTKRTHVPVVATDIDPIAVRITTDNARLNNVANKIIPITAAGMANRKIVDKGPYDLIIANILARPLTEMAPAIGRATAPGASIILSGILSTQATRVISAYALQGMIYSKRITRGDWATLILEKPRAFRRSRRC